MRTYPTQAASGVLGPKLREGDRQVPEGTYAIGCLAMGDEVAEELFALAAWVSKENMWVVIAPTDFRHKPFAPPTSLPWWAGDLYTALRTELSHYPLGR